MKNLSIHFGMEYFVVTLELRIEVRIQLTGLPHFCSKIWISSVICHGLFYVE